MNNYSSCSTQTFFLEIAKYPVLTKKEEATEIDNIYQHKQILAIVLASESPNIIDYLSLLKIRDTIIKKTGRKIQMARWAKSAHLSLQELKSIEKSAYDEWSRLANTTVDRLLLIEKLGIAARDKIILCNLRLVVQIARKYQHMGIDLLDLIQDGTIGLEHAIDKFDRIRGYRFMTYASYWAKKFIVQSIEDNARVIRLPKNIIYLSSKIRKAYKHLLDNGYPPSLSSVSKHLDISENKIRYVLEKSARVSSINIHVAEHGKKEGDILESVTNEIIDYVIDRDALKKMISNLSFKEQQVINLRYLQDSPTTLSEIGKALDMTGEGVRKIESKAILKMQRALLSSVEN
jgi:RNA polymerase nonessential primary-like sigma factor